MSELPKSFTYVLNDEIKYHKNGGEEFGSEITVFAPAPQNINEVTILEKELFKAIMNSAKLSEPKKGQQDMFTDKSAGSLEDLTSKELMNAMLMGDADVVTCYGCLKNLMTSGSTNNPSSTLDGVKITTPMFDNLSIRDRKGLLGDYIKNFIIGSLVD